MSDSKRESERAVVPAQAAQDLTLQRLSTELSDFERKPLASVGTLSHAFSASSHEKTEPSVMKTGLNVSAPIRETPQGGAWEKHELASDD